MSDQNLNYAAIRQNVEKNLHRQKWLYRVIFFAMHLLFYVVAMLTMWGTVLVDAPLRLALFSSGSKAAVMVILPTILWTMLILCHVAALYIESRVGEKSLRERLLMREVGEEFLRKGLADEGVPEKPKRRAAAREVERVMLSDDGDLISVKEDEDVQQSDRRARTNHVGDS